MSLDDLYKQQQNDTEALRRARQRAWDDLKEKHAAMHSAMGGEHQLTPEQTRQIQKDLTDFNREWSADKGRIVQEAEKRQKEERLNEASGTDAEGREERKKRLFAEQMQIINRQKAAKQTQQPQSSEKQSTQSNDNLIEKQQRMLKLLEEQKAIAERNKAKKHTK